MGNKLGNCMTALGLGSMAFYAVMMTTGSLSVDLLPQFLVSSVIFLTSGRIMRKAARAMVREEADEEASGRKSSCAPADWPWLTGLLNWTGTLLVVGLMAIFLMKPLGVSLQEAFTFTLAHEQFFATAVP